MDSLIPSNDRIYRLLNEIQIDISQNRAIMVNGIYRQWLYLTVTALQLTLFLYCWSLDAILGADTAMGLIYPLERTDTISQLSPAIEI